jgi:thiol-disulfide isomerase/thioredoxin
MRRIKPMVTISAVTVVIAFGMQVQAGEGAKATVEVAAAKESAPEFSGISHWLNSRPLKLADLRGKVVLVDFWTYGCYNCVNTLPYVTELQAKYGNKGFTVIGVHTPEFAYEKSTDSVAGAIKRHGITYPVAQDNDFATWNAYHNQYWPAQYVVDQNGEIVLKHAGEGSYEQIDRTIQGLLAGPRASQPSGPVMVTK